MSSWDNVNIFAYTPMWRNAPKTKQKGAER